MKKIICALISSLLICTLFIPINAANATAEPSRMINVVYDDSGSMYHSGSLVDTWCQAKYAMEVFAAMLGENDIPRVVKNNGYYEFDSNGRHRILAARELGYDIPVKVIGIRTRK